MEQQSFSEVKGKDGKSGGVNLNGSLQCARWGGCTAVITSHGDHD